MSENEQVFVGVIGGSGLYHLDNLTLVKTVNPETPWGFPSAPINICSLPKKSADEKPALIAFVARHGPGHKISPSHVPARANIAALKSLGVRAIVAFSAVGSLREEIPPRAFALPTQIIDRTKGIRPSTFFDGSIVAHAQFGDPFSNKLVSWLTPRVQKALAEVGNGIELHTDKCIVCMEGPQFSTRAESKMYRLWGGDLINMSVLPEAKLAREAEISYALICTATDYDSWRESEESVTAAEVFKTLQDNANTSRHVAQAVLGNLHDAIVAAETRGLSEETPEGELLLEQLGSMKLSIMPRAEARNEEDAKKLAFILPDYF